jgi:putative transposase
MVTSIHVVGASPNPPAGTHWSVRQAAEINCLSKSTVDRVFQTFALQPHRTDCKPRHRHQEFLAFLKRIDRAVPTHLDVHLIVDNYATHKHGKVRAWLAQRPRFQVHYTPTYSSWLNQVERWFGLITQQAIRRGSFRSVRELIRRIEEFVQHYNRQSRPLVWTATADSIFQKLTRLCSRISGTQH